MLITTFTLSDFGSYNIFCWFIQKIELTNLYAAMLDLDLVLRVHVFASDRDIVKLNWTVLE